MSDSVIGVNKNTRTMRRSRKNYTKHKFIDGKLYKSINSPYDGRVIGWVEMDTATCSDNASKSK